MRLRSRMVAHRPIVVDATSYAPIVAVAGSFHDPNLAARVDPLTPR